MSDGKLRYQFCMIFDIGKRNPVEVMTKETQVKVYPTIGSILNSCTDHDDQK